MYVAPNEELSATIAQRRVNLFATSRRSPSPCRCGRSKRAGGHLRVGIHDQRSASNERAGTSSWKWGYAHADLTSSGAGTTRPPYSSGPRRLIPPALWARSGLGVVSIKSIKLPLSLPSPRALDPSPLEVVRVYIVLSKPYKTPSECFQKCDPVAPNLLFSACP